jgi:hypothetical protein
MFLSVDVDAFELVLAERHLPPSYCFKRPPKAMSHRNGQSFLVAFTAKSNAMQSANLQYIFESGVTRLARGSIVEYEQTELSLND